MLDLIVTNKEELPRDVQVRDSCGCSDQEMVEFRILKGGSRAKSRTTALDFERGYFQVFRDLLGIISWDMGQERKGVQESWLITNTIKDHFLQPQERSIPTIRRSSRPACMSKNLLTEHRDKKEV